MRAIAPRIGKAEEVTLAENQLEYMPLVAAVFDRLRGGKTYVTRWTPTDDERKRIAKGEDIYVAQFLPTNETLFMPMRVDCGPDIWERFS